VTRRLVGVALTLALVAASFCIGRATTDVTFDAAFWRGLTTDEQGRYTQGLMDGHRNGFLQGYSDGDAWGIDEITRVADQFFTGNRAQLKRPWDYALDNDEKRLEALAKEGHLSVQLPGFPDTFKTYVGGITNFYDNTGALDRSPGGGGGGYYGGGGGGNGGAGGGGPGYTEPAATNVSSQNGVNSGNGSVRICWGYSNGECGSRQRQ
jgi:hypothetical protein